jgi:acyl carrier protein
MDDRAILVEVEGICRQSFANPEVRVSEGTTAADVDGWDSLSHVGLIHNLEKHFNIRIAVREATRLANVGDLVALIRRKVA